MAHLCLIPITILTQKKSENAERYEPDEYDSFQTQLLEESSYDYLLHLEPPKRSSDSYELPNRLRIVQEVQTQPARVLGPSSGLPDSSHRSFKSRTGLE